MKTHQVIFYGNMEPEYITTEQADVIIAEKTKPAKDRVDNISIGRSNYELKAIKSVREMDPTSRRKAQMVSSAMCLTCKTKLEEVVVHAKDSDCPYAMTGQCEQCHKKMWERDREYSMAQWGHVWCWDHSPLGQTVGAKPDDPAERYVQCFVTGAVGRGIPLETAVKMANRIVGRIKQETEDMEPEDRDGITEEMIKALPF